MHLQSPANSPVGPITLQPSDTAYPRFKSRPTDAELERFYTPTESERLFFDEATRSAAARLGFAVLLKTFQRLGYFVASNEVPAAVVEHIAATLGEPADRDVLGRYDASYARRKHLGAVRKFLGVKSFDGDGKTLLSQAFNDAALTKEDLGDIINVGIEVLVRHRYELPAFDTLLRQARACRGVCRDTAENDTHHPACGLAMHHESNAEFRSLGVERTARRVDVATRWALQGSATPCRER